jgi:hypothetical protein
VIDPVPIIFAIVFGFLIALFVGFRTQLTCDDIWRDRLTKSGHAEYFLDANNQRQWRMKEAK